MRGEGFSAEGIAWQLELIVEDAAGREARLTAAVDTFAAHDSVERLRARAICLLGVAHDAVLTLSTLGLFARSSVPHYRQQAVAAATDGLETALRTQRQVYLGAREGHRMLPVYDRARLGNGHALTGPVIVESGQTTMVIPAGWALRVDQYDNALIERSRQQ